MSRASTPMKFSLILATVGRDVEVERFLDHLAKQQGAEFELIVVDQNDDDRVQRLVSRFESLFTIKYLRCERGLSLARNRGLEVFDGDIVAFPDDDCWYPSGLLHTVNDSLAERPELGGVVGRCLDQDGMPSHSSPPPRAVAISRLNVWTSAISITVFLRSELVRTVGSFDETLGVGSGTKWGSGEETDYLLRALAAGFRMDYMPEIVVHHPNLPQVFTGEMFRRGRLYGAGYGRVLRKHRYSVVIKSYVLVRACGGMVLGALRGNSGAVRFHWNVLIGRLEGLLG